MNAHTTHTENGASRLPAWLKWQPIVVGAIFAALLGALFTWLAIMPRRAERDQVAKTLGDLKAENAKTKEIVDNFPAFEAAHNAKTAQFEEVTGRIRLEAEEELVSADLERLTSSVHNPAVNIRARVTLFEAGKPKPIQKEHPAMASLSEVPVSIMIRGNYAGVKKVLAELTNAERLIAVRSYEISSRPDRVAEDPDTVNASITLATFFKRAPQAVAQSAGAPAAPTAKSVK